MREKVKEQKEEQKDIMLLVVDTALIGLHLCHGLSSPGLRGDGSHNS